MYQCEIYFTCKTLSSLRIVFWHDLQNHLDFCFLSSISNIANHVHWWQHVSVLFILKFFSSHAATEGLTTSFVISSPSINFVQLITLAAADVFAKHFKTNLSFLAGLNFENGVTTWVLFANFGLFLEGRPMTVIPAAFGRSLFTIFGDIIIADAKYTAGFSLDSSLDLFLLQWCFFLLSNRIVFKILNFALL